MKTFAIFPGRFHPWHLGHKSVYDWLVAKFGVNYVFVTMTGVSDPLKSPFSFEERKKMMVLTGVPSDKIKQVFNNYNLSTISGVIPIDVERDEIAFAVSQKDMSDDPRFKNFTKKDGSPTYLQPLPKDGSKIEPAVNHGYLVVVPTAKFSVLGKNMTSATELRALYGTLDHRSKERFVIDLFGSSNKEIMSILDSKLIDRQIKEIIKEAVKRMLEEDFDQDIARLVKKRDTIDYDVEKIRQKKAEVAVRKHIENMKSIEDEGGDVTLAKDQLVALKKEYDSIKKRVSAANVRKSA